MARTEEQKSKRREYDRKLRAENGDKIRSYHKEYQRKLRRADDGKLREYWKLNKRNSDRRLKYGISCDEYDALLTQQGSKCAICKSETPGGKGTWHTDHCHETGRVRGLLCHHCNVGLGHFKDNPASLAAAIQYLQDTDDARATYGTVPSFNEQVRPHGQYGISQHLH